MADEARQQARDADAELAAGHDRGPLHGVPVSVKDLFDIRGTPTTAASHVREGHVARPRRAGHPRLRQAGAVIVGKTNLHEFAFGTTNEDSAFGPAHHPLDPDATRREARAAGRPSSVAAGMALATLGTDTGGSIRIPSAACGLVGLKPTFGEMSDRRRRAAVAHARSCRSAGAVGHRRLARASGAARSADVTAAGAAAALRDSGLACLRRYFCDVLQPTSARSSKLALETLRAVGSDD